MKTLQIYSCQLLGGFVVLAMMSPLIKLALLEPDQERFCYLISVLITINIWGCIGYFFYNIHAKTKGYSVLYALLYPFFYAPVAARWYLNRHY
ncbi:hypothetical protein [Rheinheimera sp. UJ63]|uniref:hypothetical protein n=1 Tax=Rheinheimera sp. UJ63 TaxID=2910157 RepID=UPI001F161D00|nr:hypothetical protein [Rheinheimera sp. UJ63]MCF4010560.1 hypothetical protein [Rheinheimera sp. UJ63]